jgi:hypothetical protein
MRGILRTNPYSVGTLSNRAGAVVGIAFIVVFGFLFSSVFPLMWSNHCDPDNALFKRLKSDPMVSFHAPGEWFTIETIRPDNSFVCTAPSITESHYGDPELLYPELRTNLLQNGWTQDPTGYASVYQKNAGGGIVMTARLRKFFSTVDVKISIPGLHAGESGFQ